MLYVRRGFGDEKSQLNELNVRLDQYLSRVRQLETENQHLVEEIHKLRLERGAEWTQVYHSEVCELRKRVEELTIQKCEAELQRDNFAEELQELQELWEQVRSIRLKIDQQLILYKQDLQQAQQKQAALEQLYIQLQQECQMLQGSHEEEIIALRDQAFQIPLQITMQEVLRPKLSLTDVQSFSLELSESWKEAFVFYQKKIEELESILRRSEEDRHGAEEEITIYRLQVEKLCKEYEELLAMKTMLEDELLRMKAKYRLEVEEYQVIIEELETEKKTITINITERLRDYHDLMQAKTGLSLEVAAYRALLEAESKKGEVIITEHTVRDRPAGYVTSTLEETTRFSNRGREKFEYPTTKSKDEIQWKAQTADSRRFLTRTVPQTQIAPRYTHLGNTSSSYGSRSHETLSQERCGRWDTSFSTKYDSSRKSGGHQTVQPIAVSPYASTETIISQTKQQEQMKDQRPVARPRSHSKETRRGQVDIMVENKQQESDSQNVFATEVGKDRKSESQSVREAKQVIEDNVTMTANENRKKYDETVSVTETVQKETIQEPKTQELPVKKERKKKELAKKRKEEMENVAVGDMNVTGLSAEVYETTQVKKTTVLGEKANDQPIVYEIPIQFEKRKQEGNEEYKARNVSQTYVNQETISQRNTMESGKTNHEFGKETILVDEYLKQLGQSSVFNKNETNILEEKNQDSRFMRTFVFGEKSGDKKVVMEIPIQLEENKKETSSYKENVENSAKSRVSENVNKINISKEESLEVDMENLHQDFETNEFSRAEESSSTSSDTIEKKALVTDILKQLGHPSDLDDANVSYSERKEKYSDGSVKTEILVESKIEEEMDLFDEPDLTDLWTTTSFSSSKKSEAATTPVEEIQSRKIKKTILEDISGAEAEEWIGNVIRTGLKGSPGKSVNVEIVEESIGTFTYEKGEYSTPFHVEEAEDNYNKEESVNTEEMPVSVGTDQIHDNIQPSESPAQVEEITEGEHVDEEIDYFVSIPDESPRVQEEEEETIRGQIHTEEESHVTYSWQDEFLQGSQGRKGLSEMLKQAAATEQSSMNYRNTADYSDTVDKEEQKETSHVETVVIEKTNTYGSLVDRDGDLQTQQQNKDTHVEIIGIAKAATYGLSVDRNDSFDMKKQEGELHVKTIGIEKADSYGTSVDSSVRFNTKGHKGESHVETVVIEKTIKASPEIQSTLIHLLSKDITDPQQKLRGALDCLQGSLPDELIEELSTLAGEDQTQTSSLAVNIKKLGQTDESGTMTIVAEINISKTLDTDNLDDLELNTRIESEESTIPKSQTRSSEDALQKEGITAVFGDKTYGNEDFYNSVTVGINNREESYTSEENVAKSPTSTKASFGQITTDVGRFIKHIELDTKKHMFQEDFASAQDSAASLSPTDTNRSEHHIKLAPTEPLYNKQIIFEGPISETLKLDIVKNTEETSEQNRSIRHIKISPTETVPTEQIIFQGPLFKTVGMGATGELSVHEKNVEHVSQATKSLVFERFQVGSQETTSHSTDFTAGTSKIVSHFKVNSGESLSKQIMFEGSIPKTHDFSRPSILNIDNSEEDSRPIEHSSATQKIHVAKQVKYQGFVSQHHAVEDYGNNAEQNDQGKINTSVHHIKLSPSKEHIVLEGPISANFNITGEDKTYVEDTDRPIRHIRLGSPKGQISEHVTFEGPTTESYESSDFFVSSPSGDSTESERSIKHIRLGPKEKTFTFQMDITKIATKHSEEKGAEDSGMVITSSKFEGQPEFSQSSTELMDDLEVAESGYGEEEIAGVSQYAYEIVPQSQNITETSQLEKTVQIQRILHQSHIVSDEKKVAIVYLDEEEEEEEEEEEADQDYLRRSF
ncbi:PREDICTED: synemin [Nanorana parkeri]|uniref:synemin n=1 Tax=Nanorana parkeri TaxID=125878 RepID=UPI000854FC94|nr:PREDICTED: synemin [Nanorana parkeri]